MTESRILLHALRDLVDRQIVDVDGLLAGKVDDILLEPSADGMAVTGLLSGAGALAPRLDGRLGARFEDTVRRLSGTLWEPRCITPDLYKRTDSGIELTVPRAYLHETAPRAAVPHRRPEGAPGELDDFRVSDVIGAHVFDADGEPIAGVAEVRLCAYGPATGAVGVAMTLDALLVGLGAVGDRLGYALPHGPKRPFALNRVFRAFARRAQIIPWRAVERVEPRRISLSVRSDALFGIDQDYRL